MTGMMALFVGADYHGQKRDVQLDHEGKWPGAVDHYLFWRVEAGPVQYAVYLAAGCGQRELEDAAHIAGLRWGDTP